MKIVRGCEGLGVRRLVALTGVALVVSLTVVPAVHATSTTSAEILSSNLFMGTTKVEVGSRPNGSFGSSVNAPTTPVLYHPRPNTGLSSGQLGFRGNPTECNWDDASCIQISQGDFFVPGTPYEAWALQVGASGTAAFNTNMTSGISGSFTGFSASAPSGTWEAGSAYDGIQVRFDYSLPTYSWLVNADVTLTNTTASPISDVYFLRGVDADNCKADPTTGRPPPPLCTADTGGGTTAPVTDTYQTFDTVVSNGPAAGTAKVTATQTDETYLSLQLASTTAKAFRKPGGGFAISGNLASIYNGTDGQYASDVGNTVLGDNAMYIVEKISSIPAGGSVTLPVKYVLKEGAPIVPPKELTVAKTGSGTVTSSPAGIDCGSTCAYSFNDGTIVTLTATADAGNQFSGWGGACASAGTNLTCDVTMSEARSVTAAFASAPAGTFPLSVSKTGTGTVTGGGIDCGTTCVKDFDPDTKVTLTAKPGSGYSFDPKASTCPGTGWTAAANGSYTCEVTMSKAQEVKVVFVADMVIRSTSVNGGTTDTKVRVPGPGRLTQRATRLEGGKRITACRTAPRRTTRAQTVNLRCLQTYGTKMARRKGPVVVRLCTTFRPTDGTATTKCRRVTLASTKPNYTG